MKKLVILLAILCLCACSKVKEEPKEELIKIYEEERLSFYVATPSGILYYATDSEPVVYTDENGKTRNIFDDVAVETQ